MNSALSKFIRPGVRIVKAFEVIAEWTELIGKSDDRVSHHLKG
jgi:hypothetical protein